jgi:CheY-like chemotaxis protein
VQPGAARLDPTAPIRILVADDSEDNRAVVRAYLKDTPCVLDFANDGVQALEKLKGGEYDLALVDVHMPGLDGHAAVRSFREFERAHDRPALPVLALTADAFKESIDRSLASGFTMHLAKPIRKVTLIEAIRRHARVSTRAVAATSPGVVIDQELSAIVPKYIANLRRNPAGIAAALARADFDTVRSTGHNMKGTGTSFGLPQITAIGDELEVAAKAKDADAIRRITDELVHFLDSLSVHYK